ncbi:hypothetical protein [uncultured Sphingobacterium sp.]|uniref:hypothetical protein n=1 Tax=uncultured Sphingobacterium sp. TaxID=182688 RepID=UPI0025EE0ECD|nr:hypothetical protein [uncultured Sphingobacterium sp.]
MWTQMREVVIKNFPASPGIPANHDLYIKNIDDIYLTDAYHSLSIERYRATHEIIAKVSSGESNGKENEEDPKQRDTMAARVYYQAFLSVKESVDADKYAVLLECKNVYTGKRDHKIFEKSQNKIM